LPYPEFTLYGRAGCHLCHEMAAALRATQQSRAFSFRSIDIDRDPALQAGYTALVPVLSVGEREICRFRLDRAALDAELAIFL